METKEIFFYKDEIDFNNKISTQGFIVSECKHRVLGKKHTFFLCLVRESDGSITLINVADIFVERITK